MMIFSQYEYKTDKVFLIFGENQFEKLEFICYKCPIKINNVNIDKKEISDKFNCTKKGFYLFFQLKK